MLPCSVTESNPLRVQVFNATGLALLVARLLDATLYGDSIGISSQSLARWPLRLHVAHTCRKQQEPGTCPCSMMCIYAPVSQVLTLSWVAGKRLLACWPSVEVAAKMPVHNQLQRGLVRGKACTACWTLTEGTWQLLRVNFMPGLRNCKGGLLLLEPLVILQPPRSSMTLC